MLFLRSWTVKILMQVFNVDTFHGTPVATKRSSVASIEKKVTHRISCKVREAALAGWLARPLACAQEERSRTVHRSFCGRGLQNNFQREVQTQKHLRVFILLPPELILLPITQGTAPSLEQRGVSALTRLCTHGFSKDVGQISFASDGLLRPGS